MHSVFRWGLRVVQSSRRFRVETRSEMQSSIRSLTGRDRSATLAGVGYKRSQFHGRTAQWKTVPKIGRRRQTVVAIGTLLESDGCLVVVDSVATP